MEITFLSTSTKNNIYMWNNSYRTPTERWQKTSDFPKGSEQIPSGDLHAEAGPNPKLNSRSCANREEKGKFFPAASGAVD